MNNEKAKNAKRRDKKVENTTTKKLKDLWNCYERFMKLLKVKLHNHEIECHISNRFKKIVNGF